MRGIVTVVTMLLAVGFSLAQPTTESSAAFSLFSSHKKIKDTGGNIVIPLADVSDGNAHYYQYKTSSNTVKFFIIKSRDGVVRAAFDACDVCFSSRKGYSQDGEVMICNNCGQRFHSSRINVVKGGCNPAPLERNVIGNNLVITVADVLPGSRFF